jgi:uncharacterized protein (TIGR01777 family)
VHVFVTGATGFVGPQVVAAFLERGDRVTAISRNAARAKETLGAHALLSIVEGEIEKSTNAIAGCDAIVHLAGEPVATKRWDARQKQVIRESRVESTRAIVEAIGKLDASSRPRVLVSASGTDYYPFVSGEFDDDDDVTEADPPSDSFLGRVCRDWEAEAANAEAHGVRVVRLRIGGVFGKGGGALAKIVPTFKAFVGGSLGDGKQWFSWVHRDDVVRVILAATKDDRYTGPINVVAPTPTRYRELAKVIGHQVHRPSFWRVPGFALKIAVGEFAEYLMNGRKVVPKKLLDLGYEFAYTDVTKAVHDSL